MKRKNKNKKLIIGLVKSVIYVSENIKDIVEELNKEGKK